MKISDIKGKIANEVMEFVEQEVNDRLCKMLSGSVRETEFSRGFSIPSNECLKRILSGKEYGYVPGDQTTYTTHWAVRPIVYPYDMGRVKPNQLQFEYHDDLMDISLRLTNTNLYENFVPCEDFSWAWMYGIYNIKINKPVMMNVLSETFDAKLIGMDTTMYDINGRMVKVGDLVVYGTIYDEDVHIGKVTSLTDMKVAIDGRMYNKTRKIFVIS